MNGKKFGNNSSGNWPQLGEIVDILCGDSNTRRNQRVLKHPAEQILPSRDEIINAIEGLRTVLYPGYFGISDLSAESMRYHIGSALDRTLRVLEEQIRRGLCFVCPMDERKLCSECEASAVDITRKFLDRLPEVQHLLATDVTAAYEGDPAATSPDEAVFCYPGLLAITDYRLAHELHLLGVPVIPRIITEYAHSITGIDIHPGANIGERFFIDHGTGVVIGETSVIGRNVCIYQGVTLGAKSFPLDEHGNPIKGVARHPIVEDDVIIYAGATILGRVTIGKGAVVGGNVWVTRDVAPGGRVTQAAVRRDQFESGGGI